MKYKILLVEDDPNLGMLLKDYLTLKGFDICWEKDGDAGFQSFNRDDFHLCVLDVMLPKMDGFTLAKQILKVNKNNPIIFLTAKSQIEDLQEGFNIGADDYITKPFNSEELLMRINAILRRAHGHKDPQNIQEKYTIGKFIFDKQKQLLINGNEETKLTYKESKLLELFSENINQLVERDFALKAIWQDDTYFNARSMDVYISKLRKHLKADNSLEIVNLHGEGYKLISK